MTMRMQEDYMGHSGAKQAGLFTRPRANLAKHSLSASATSCRHRNLLLRLKWK